MFMEEVGGIILIKAYQKRTLLSKDCTFEIDLQKAVKEEVYLGFYMGRFVRFGTICTI